MPNSYKGMRWLKCDLHMQTPADTQHWSGDRLIPGQEALAAQAFAHACYSQRLDVVGITDHNFLSKNFISHLRTAFSEVEREFGHCITLFPGFEFEAAGVGRGVHVLCLFEPETDLARVDAILTECGVSYPRINALGQLEKSDKNLKDILRIVQDRYGGLVILPHATSNDGIFDNESISEWLQRDQYINDNLLAVEVPKPVHMMSAGYQRLLRSGEDCDPSWKRIRPVATLMSSDNKRLIDLDAQGKPKPNTIGYRYSWIKMSQPSIEALRQACLDHESRVLLPDDVASDTHPAQRASHTTINMISIKNVAFLADQELHFSPNMTCVIGGRGSGKSTLLEYLRIILGKDGSKDIDPGTRERIARVRETLEIPDAEVEVRLVSSEGVEDRIVWQGGGPTVQDRELADPETFFSRLPVRFYSQQQLNRLTESKSDDGSLRQAQRLLELIDGFATHELDDLADREQRLRLQIRDASTELQKAGTLKSALKRLQQEYQELDRQWKARGEVQEDARQHQMLKAEARYMQTLAGSPGKQFADVASMAEAIAAAHERYQVHDSRRAAWFMQFDDAVREAKESLAKAVRMSVEQYQASIDSLLTGDPQWIAISEELDHADTRFAEACAAKGLSTDDVGRLQEIDLSRTKKLSEIGKTEEEIARRYEAAGDLDALMAQLHQVWREQFQTRVVAAERANQLAVLNDGRQRFIEVSAKYQQDYSHFRELWQAFSPADGRTRLARNWESCGEVLYMRFTEHEAATSPWQLLADDSGSTELDFGASSSELRQYIRDNTERWQELRCSRVQDVVDMTLFRADGSTAGSIAEGSLSDGQRNTAALALLLAQEGGPLVIDQPEDELDSNFVFRELIPMLRTVKSRRQLILATHNANLPVNGDAELVYAFEARQGRGDALACGGLDQAAVTKAVLDIMEGTEEAFRRRREKYHF